MPKVKIKNNALWDKLTSDSIFRLLVTTSFSMGWNFLYSLFQVVLAFVYQSPWHITMFVYYIILALMRFSVIASKNKNVLIYNGIAMIFLAIAMSGIICLSITENKTTIYHIIIIITIATYTFYQMTISIINIIKANKTKNCQLIILRNIAVASSIGSMFSLECSMLGTFGDIKTSYARNMEIISGAFAVAVILFLSFSML
ncbi:MAG: hypothetical protein K2J88_07725, partial [Oscillospiraceae bacterium]|nr:hypothetical protein [Oscillospiraceae bacterium]